MTFKIDTKQFSPEEKTAIKYLEQRMQLDDERSILARIVYQQVSFGRLNARSLAEQLGAFTSEGIYSDDGDIETNPLIAGSRSLMDTDPDALEDLDPMPTDERVDVLEQSQLPAGFDENAAPDEETVSDDTDQ